MSNLSAAAGILLIAFSCMAIHLDAYGLAGVMVAIGAGLVTLSFIRGETNDQL